MTHQSTRPRTELPEEVETAIDAALDKKADNVVVLDLTGICSFTDRFILCTGASRPQTQAIADNILHELKEAGMRPSQVEGHSEGNWILIDYVDFVFHIFTPDMREFYDLERLWRQGKRFEVLGMPEEERAES